MDLYLLPSILAISAKISLFFISRKALFEIDKKLLSFFLALFGVNVFELALLMSLPSMKGSMFFMVMYYNFAVMSIAAILCYALSLVGKCSVERFKTIIFVSIVAIGCATIPGVGLSGVSSIGYSVTRLAGPYYFVVQGVLLIGASLAFYFFYRARRSADVEVSRRAKVLFIAISPMLVSVPILILAMQLGYKVNATLIISLETSFMMALLIYVESSRRLFKFLTLVPATSESKQWQEISGMLTDENMSLKEAQTRFTELFVENALRRADGNQVQAAKLLNTSRSTVYRYLPEKSGEKS